MKKECLVSVVIPTKDRAYVLEKTIDSLVNQTYKNIEIIVVDDGSTDGTELLVEGFKKKYKRIKFLKNKKNMGPAASRNKGVKNAKGEIIFFTDSDCFVSENWIETVIKEYKDEEVVGVGGYLKPGSNNWIAKLENLQNKYLLKIGSKRIKGKEKTPTGYTNSMTYKKSVFDEVGGFDEHFKLPSGEDVELKKRIAKKGYLVYLPLPVIHLDTYNLDYLTSRIIARGIGTKCPKNKTFRVVYIILMLPVIIVKVVGKIIKYKLQGVV
jgi:glycosyltransferase involved in cell wall biosynthesis